MLVQMMNPARDFAEKQGVPTDLVCIYMGAMIHGLNQHLIDSMEENATKEVSEAMMKSGLESSEYLWSQFKFFKELTKE